MKILFHLIPRFCPLALSQTYTRITHIYVYGIDLWAKINHNNNIIPYNNETLSTEEVQNIFLQYPRQYSLAANKNPPSLNS